MTAARILVAGGGTGGHLYPALHLADAIRRREPSAEVLYVGARRGLEARILPERELPHRLLPMRPLHRRRPWRNWRLVRDLPELLGGLGRTFREFDPEVVVGTGGYASLPVLAWGWATGRPLAIQEQNARPGLATRLAARLADQVHLGFPEAAARLRTGPRTRVFAPGNPVAPQGTAPRCAFPWPEGRVLLVAGGSQGARDLNRRLASDLEGRAALPEEMRIVWVAGPEWAPEISERIADHPAASRIRVVPFIPDLGVQLGGVAAAVSRAGAMFLSELAAAGVPAVLVPFPGAAGGHQEENARILARGGAALIRRQGELAPGELLATALGLLADERRLARMARAARRRAAPEAADRIAEALLRLAREGSVGEAAVRIRRGGPGEGGDAGGGERAAAERLPRRSDLPAPGSGIHLMGVGGAGMRGLALLLAEGEYRVSGCDRAGPVEASELRERDVELLAGHDPAHVGEGTRLLVRSAAVPEEHPEAEAARGRGIPVWQRGRALAALVNDATTVAVCGTHGKTTVTAMTARACEAGGLDPLAAVGGRLPEWGANARAGGGALAVVEADEYGGAFLEIDPDLAVLTSVEPEHVESYGGVEGLRDAFRRFLDRAVPRRGVLFCADDPGAAELGRESGAGRGYGFAPDAAYRIAGAEEGGGTPARLSTPGGELELAVRIPGRHNLRNAAAALAAAIELGADPAAAAGALREFGGVERRLETLCDRDGVAVVDDYAHHPTEVRASLGAVRGLHPDRRVVAVFQPHLYSRTRRFAREFARELEGADAALVLPIYPAREDPLPGVTSELIVEAAGESVGPVRPEALGDRLREEAAAGGPVVFLFMGAGDVTERAREAAADLGGVEEGGAG